MKKKIVIFTYSLVGGGAERTVANLLTSLDRRKYDIYLVLMNTNVAYKIPYGQIIHYIEKSDQFESNTRKLIKLPFLASRFARYCKENEIELVFSFMNRPNMIATMAKWFGLKAKVLISEQFYTPYLYNNDSISNRFKTWLLKKCYGKAECILPNSQGTMAALRDDFKIKTNYKLIKNPTDIKSIRDLREETITEPIDFNKFTFLNIAAFRPEKNHELLIDAVYEIRDRDFQLLLVGEGLLLNQLKEKVNKLGLDKKIIFVPFTCNPFKYLYRSSCFILSSFAEGFPNILIEAMICDLPIIAVDCKTGPRELLAPGTSLHTIIPYDKFEIAQYGLLCAVNAKTSLVAAMNWALDHPEKLKDFHEHMIDKGNEFDFQKVADDLSVTIDQYLDSAPVKSMSNPMKKVFENSGVLL